MFSTGFEEDRCAVTIAPSDRLILAGLFYAALLASSGSASYQVLQAVGVHCPVFRPTLLSLAAASSSAKVIVSNLSLTKTC
jgi:hypothetical protein